MNNLSAPGQMLAAGNMAKPATPGSRSEGIDIDLRDIGAVIRRYWLTLAIIMALALATGIIITARAPKLYRASATVQIEQQSSKVLSSEEDQASVAQDADRFLQTQLSLLNSRALASLVVDQLKLAETIPARNPGSEVELTKQERKAVAIQQLQDGLSVTLPRDSRVAQITFTGPDPKLVAKIANAYADNFIVYNLQRRYGESSYARTFLQRELGDAKKRLEASESGVVNYARSNRLVDIGTSGPNASGTTDGTRLLTASSILDVNSALARAQVSRIEAERKWQQAISTPAIALPEVMSNTAIQQLLQQRAQNLAAYDKDRQSFKPHFPAMKEAQAQLETLARPLQLHAEGVRKSLRNNYLLAAQQENALAAKLEALKSETLNEQSRSIQYNTLRREVDTNRLMYDGLLQRFKEVSAAAGVTANNISVVDRAVEPQRPFTPRARLNIISSLVGGLALGPLLREPGRDVVDRQALSPSRGALPRAANVARGSTATCAGQASIACLDCRTTRDSARSSRGTTRSKTRFSLAGPGT